MIQVTDAITIDESEIKQEFICASGPGGQNVDKVATAVQIRFDVHNSPSLPDEVRERLVSLAGKRITDNGLLIIDARRFRTQERNRHDGMQRLVALIQRAVEEPKSRLAPKPSKGSKMRRLDMKRRRSETKRLRAAVSDFES
jgi:ribosome-associated protein